MTFGRVHRAHDLHGDLLAMAFLVGVSAVTVGVGWMLVHLETVGDAMFVVAILAGIWLRRFGPRARRVGTLTSLPFIAMLVAPVGGDLRWQHILWTVLAARWRLVLTALEELRPTPRARPRMAGLPIVEDEASQPIHAVSDLLEAGRAISGFAETVQACPAVLGDPEIRAALLDLHQAVTEARCALRPGSGAGRQ
jgi:hypothetical protein